MSDVPSPTAKELLNNVFLRVAALFDSPFEKDGHQLLETIFQLKWILSGFQNSKTKRIKGPGGVADALGLSRNALYWHLKKLSLRPKDFRNAHNVFVLIEKSPVIREKYHEIMQSHLDIPVT